MDWSPILLTLKLATTTTALLLLLGVPLAWWLSRNRSGIQPMIETVVSLPLVLPPSVLGFYLLLAFSPRGALGGFLSGSLGLDLAFSFKGLVLASLIYNLPFMVNPVLAAFRGLPPSLAEASAVLGKGPWAALWHVLLPAIRPALLGASAMTFAHCIGEFGVVLMIGGSIPGETRVASIAVFEAVEGMRYGEAHIYAAVLLLCSGGLLLASTLWMRRGGRGR